MALKQFTDDEGKVILVESTAVFYVRNYIPSAPPAPPSSLQSCLAFNNGTGVYVQESVEKVYAILTE